MMAMLLVRAKFCMQAGPGAGSRDPAIVPPGGRPGPGRGFLLFFRGRRAQKGCLRTAAAAGSRHPAAGLHYSPRAAGLLTPGTLYLGLRYSLASLDFLDDDHLLFTFRVPGLIHRDLSHREIDGNDPNEERKIRAVVLKLPEGTVQAETVWTLHDRKRYLWMLDNGQFLLRDREICNSAMQRCS